MPENNVIIAPSILAADFSRLGEQVREAAEGGADWIHIDVMDGHFVPNITMGPMVVEACRRMTQLPLDVHLMIEYPERHIDAFAAAGADSLTGHVETCPHLHRTIQQIRAAGCRAGVALTPATPLVMVEGVLAEIDLLLVMSVNPGFGGQAFIQESLEKVRTARAEIGWRSPSVLIQMDGGISADTIAGCREAGNDVFVAGSAIFRSPAGIATAIEGLRKAAEAA